MTSSPSPVVDRQFLQMRERVLSLAADLDRVDRAKENADPRISALKQCVQALLEPAQSTDRAERVQFLLSDRSAPPSR